MIWYEKKLYVALIVLLLVFLYYNFALEKLVEEQILDITEDETVRQESIAESTEATLETTTTTTASTSSSTQRKG